jgi:uncharacterized membrane protein HdeD (DUF308 family)
VLEAAAVCDGEKSSPVCEMKQVDINARHETNVTTVHETALRHKAVWCTNVGTALIVLGILSLFLLAFPDANPVILIGWLLVVSGLAEAVHAFHLRKSDAFLFHLVPAIAGLPIGVLVVTHPSAQAAEWMLVFASSFTVMGLFRAISAFHLQFHNWTWTALDGVVTLILAGVFWTALVWFVPWFFCLAVGVSLILRGLSSMMFGLGPDDSQRASSKRLHYHTEKAYLTQFLHSGSK